MLFANNAQPCSSDADAKDHTMNFFSDEIYASAAFASSICVFCLMGVLRSDSDA
jgi:hypothetical protein